MAEFKSSPEMMPADAQHPGFTFYGIAASVLMVVALVAVLPLGLISALLSGLLVYHLTESLVPFVSRAGIHDRFARTIILLFLASLVVGAISLLVFMFAAQLSGGPDSFAALLRTLADIVEGLRSKLPESVQGYLQPNFEEITRSGSRWLRDNALQVTFFGRRVATFLIHTIAGMVIGGMIVFARNLRSEKPLGAAFGTAMSRLSNVFQRVVIAQIRISALNTMLTALYLLWLMPALGMGLPATQTLIAVTFIAGLLPVAGNLISNTAITLVALSVSPLAAVISLGYLVAIHKLEYFFNARIIGAQVGVRAWEMLIAMLAMEAAFGLAGLIAAPIYYTYVKDELRWRNLI
jgi:predicted PurR-regulated permease PerM